MDVSLERIAVLGGPGTFSAQAANQLKQSHPALGELAYFPSGGEVWKALKENAVQGAVVTAETTRTGFAPVHEKLAPPDARFFITAEQTVPYECSLLTKPGTLMQDIRTVLGHGSLQQCLPFLARALPNAAIRQHEHNSVEAAREVAAGDGTFAVVSTLATARETGLVELAGNIDEGSLGNFWLVTTEPLFVATPDRVIVVGRFAGGGELGGAIAALGGAGYGLRTVYSQASGMALFEYDYVLSFAGNGELSAIRRELEPFGTARLVGAFDAPRV